MSWFVNRFAEEIWQRKYAGGFTNIKDFYRSLARNVAGKEKEWEEPFFDLLWDKKFSPGGRILAWAGRPNARVSLMNCTTHKIEGDSIEAISQATHAVMKASSRGQGIGVDLSVLRPRDAAVNNSAKTSTGAISFMELINHAGGIIGQEGRRAALLFSINDSHPDLWRPGAQDLVCSHCEGSGCEKCDNTGHFPYDFLNIKRVNGRVTNANISVNISDAFMEAVEKDEPWWLEYVVNSSGGAEQVREEVSARKLFEAIAKSAHKSAEPGVLFTDTTRKLSNSDAIGPRWKVVGVNACTEQLLDQEGVCNLGSMNLAAYVVKPWTDLAYFDIEQFDRDVRLAIRFLDNVLDIELRNNNSISIRQRNSIEELRRIGLGVMGLADCLAMLGLPYGDNDNTLAAIRVIFTRLRDSSYEESVLLAEEKGPAKVFNGTENFWRARLMEKAFFRTLPRYIKDQIVEHGLRNVTLLSVAPTGTISNLLGVSSGIEPLFAKEYVRRYRMNGHDEFVNYVHPGVQQSRQHGLPDSLWRTAYEVSPLEHIIVQSEAQHFVDQSISKTTNLPSDATVQDVMEVYRMAHALGLKGLAVYVDGSRQFQILHEKEECPVCEDGGQVIRQNGCKECVTCGWSVCLT